MEVDGYCITSKEGRRINFPSEELAVAVAADWEFMHRRVDPKRMPLVRYYGSFPFHSTFCFGFLDVHVGGR